MATKIILKKSTASGAAPLVADLDQAELAINLADRKIYTKDNSGAIVKLDGAYVDPVAPGNPSKGDIWYDTENNYLKAYNGSAWVNAGYTTLGEFGITATASELNILDGATLTTIELNHVDGVTGPIQTQLDGKAASVHTHTSTNITDFNEAAQDAVGGIISGAGIVSVTYDDNTNTITVSATEADTLDSVTDRGNTTGNSITVGSLQTTANVTVGGNLIVNGTTTTVNSNEVNIGDSTILLNSDETGNPSLDAGFEVNRGTENNVYFVWN
jgi:hypothetical protein